MSEEGNGWIWVVVYDAWGDTFVKAAYDSEDAAESAKGDTDWVSMVPLNPAADDRRR